MDILIHRGESKTPKRMVTEDPLANPYITKPSACLTIRSLIERYARGEVGFVPQKMVEPVVDSDEVVPVQDYSSELDKAQRVDDFRKSYNKAVDNYERSVKESAETDSKGDNGSSDPAVE